MSDLSDRGRRPTMRIRRRCRDSSAPQFSRSRRQEHREFMSAVRHHQEAVNRGSEVDEAEIRDILQHTRQVTDSLRRLPPRRSF